MEVIVVLVGVAVVGWFVIGPIIVFTLVDKVRKLESDIAFLRERIREFAAAQPTARVEKFVQSGLSKADEMTAVESPTHPALDRTPPTEPAVVPGPPPPLPPRPSSVADAVPRPATQILDDLAADAQRAGTKPVHARGPDLPVRPFEMPTIEEIVAGKWLAWIGSVALIVGVGFFLKFAIDRGWIGPRERVGLGLVGSALLYMGAIVGMRRDYRWFAQGLAGSALGMAFMSLYAAHEWYLLIGLTPTFAAMVVAAGATLAFAAIFDAEAAAFLGLLGGFLTPVLLSTGQDAQWTLFTYLLLLDAVVLFLSGFKRWQSVQVLSLLGTAFLWSSWMEGFYFPEKFQSTVIQLTAFWLLFVAITAWQHGIRKVACVPADFFVLLATPVLFFAGLQFAFEYYPWTFTKLQVAVDEIVRPAHPGQMGRVAVALSAAYAAIAFYVHRLSDRTSSAATFALAGISLTFVTLAVPLEFTRHWITIAWALESLILIEVGLHWAMPALRRVGFGLFAVVLVIVGGYLVGTFAQRYDEPRFFDRPTAVATRPVLPRTSIFNGHTFAFVAVAGVAAIVAWEYRRRFAADAESVAGNSTWQEQEPYSPGWTADIMAAVAFATALGLAVAETYHQAGMRRWLGPTLLGAWTGYVGATAFAGIWLAARWRSATLRRAAQVCFAAAGVLAGFGLLDTLANWRVMVQAHPPRPSFDRTFWIIPLLNPRGIGMMVSLFAAAMGARLLSRSMRDPMLSPRQLSDSENLGVLAYAIGLATITAETYAQGILRVWNTGTSLAVTFNWTVYAAALLAVGIAIRFRPLRILGLLTFGFTTLKVFLYDIWHLGITIRFIAFGVLGVALLTTSFLYRRYRDRIKTWIAEVQSQ